MVNNSTNINKTNNDLSPSLTEKKTHDIWRLKSRYWYFMFLSLTNVKISNKDVNWGKQIQILSWNRHFKHRRYIFCLHFQQWIRRILLAHVQGRLQISILKVKWNKMKCKKYSIVGTVPNSNNKVEVITSKILRHHDLIDRYGMSVSLICSTCRKHFPVVSPFTTYYWICN